MMSACISEIRAMAVKYRHTLYCLTGFVFKMMGLQFFECLCVSSTVKHLADLMEINAINAALQGFLNFHYQ